MLPRRGLDRACLVLPFFVLACAAPQSPPPPSEAAIVYVIERGWHTDIGLPVNEIAGPLVAMEAAFPGVRVLTFGFGERQFVVDRRQSIVAMLRALLPSRSALLITALRTTPEIAFGPANVVVLPVTRTALEKIEAAIWQDFERSAMGDPVRLATGPYSGSVFYAGQETYNGLFTCNTWTAKILRAGDLPMPVGGVLFSGQVMGMARWLSTQRPSPPDKSD